MMRRLLVLAGLALGVAVLMVFVGTALLWWLVPGDRQRIVGLALGSRDNVTRIPRAAMSCVQHDPSRPDETCTATIDGSALTVAIEYREGFRFQRCTATSGLMTTPCWPVWFAVTGPAIYASIPTVEPGQPHESIQWLRPGGVERVQMPHLELTEASRQDLRRRYPFTNFSEREWVLLLQALAFVAALVSMAGALLLSAGRLPIQRLAWRQALSIRGIAAAVACGGAVFGLSYVGLIVQAMRAGLVD